MRNMSPPPHKQDNGMDRTHKAMGQRIHRDNDHDRDKSRGDRIVARGDGGRFPVDADDRNRSPTSREAHPERPVDYKSLVEDRVHGRNDPQRKRHNGGDNEAKAGKPSDARERETVDAPGGRFGLHHYSSDQDRRGYEKSYQREHNNIGRYERSVHDLQKDGRSSRED